MRTGAREGSDNSGRAQERLHTEVLSGNTSVDLGSVQQAGLRKIWQEVEEAGAGGSSEEVAHLLEVLCMAGGSKEERQAVAKEAKRRKQYSLFNRIVNEEFDRIQYS